MCVVGPGNDTMERDAQQTEKVAEVSINNVNHVDDIFTCFDLYSPDIYPTKFKFKEALKSKIVVPIAESAEDFVSKVACDVAKLDIVDVKEDDL